MRRLTSLLSIFLLLSAVAAITSADPPTIIDTSSRAHVVEFGLEDVRLRNEEALPSLEQTPADTAVSETDCLDLQSDCVSRADLNLSPASADLSPGGSEVDKAASSSLHRLRRDVRESRQATHETDHLIENTLERMADPARD